MCVCVCVLLCVFFQEHAGLPQSSVQVCKLVPRRLISSSTATSTSTATATREDEKEGGEPAEEWEGGEEEGARRPMGTVPTNAATLDDRIR